MSQIIGGKELQAKLAKLGNLSFLKPVITAQGTYLKGKIAIYPPAGSANSSSWPTWYERGYGPRWRRKDGSIGGRKTSEKLRNSWTSKVESNTRAVVGNDASYAKWVQGGETQTSIMHDIGWKDTDTVVEEESEAVLKEIQKAVDRALRG